MIAGLSFPAVRVRVVGQCEIPEAELQQKCREAAIQAVEYPSQLWRGIRYAILIEIVTALIAVAVYEIARAL